MKTRTDNGSSSADFWAGEEVDHYETTQRLMVEQKAAVLDNIVRIVDYFCRKRSFFAPTILDVGCGTGALTGMLLEKIAGSRVTGVDGSEEMLKAFDRYCRSRFPSRCEAIHADFNRRDFWGPMKAGTYDVLVSSMALHYLTDDAAARFFKAAHSRLTDHGVLVACIGNLSESPALREMAYQFKLEFAYTNRKANGYDGDFAAFKADFASRVERIRIHWRSPGSYLALLDDAGFQEVDMVWHLWLKSIFVALKPPPAGEGRLTDRTSV